MGPVGDVEEKHGGETHRAQVAHVLEHVLRLCLEYLAAEPDGAGGVPDPHGDEGPPLETYLHRLSDRRMVRQRLRLPALQHVRGEAEALLVGVQRMRKVLRLQLVRIT